MRQWEYSQVVVPLGTELQQCQAMGDEGWELVSMAHVNVAPSALALPGQMPAQMGWLLMFKRQKVAVTSGVGASIMVGAASANGNEHGQNRI